MAYDKTTWVTGDVVTATRLNNIETGLEAADATANAALYLASMIGEDGAIDTNNLADESVNDDKLADGSVTNPKLASGSVSRPKLDSALAHDIDNKASADGFYEDMTVGNAEQIISTVGTTDNSPYLFRTSGGNANIGDRLLDKIIGGTVAWNQRASVAPISSTVNGITRVSSEDGKSVTYSGEATTSGNFKCCDITGWISGHIYYMSLGNVELPSGCLISSSFGDSEPYVIYPRATASVGVYITAGIDIGTFTVTPIAIDLTEMFGPEIANYLYSMETSGHGTDSSGSEWFRRLFPKEYYEYNTGELISVKTSAHETTGFNQWDEVWELGGIDSSGDNSSSTDVIRSKNFIHVISGETYYFKTGSDDQSDWQIQVFCYDYNKVYIGTSVYKRNAEYTIPNKCSYIRFTTTIGYGTSYKNDICINISHSGYRNGEYEKYEKHTYPLDDGYEFRGIFKLDSFYNLYYDGDTYESDGTVTRKYGIVDLGTLDWSYSAASEERPINRFDTSGLASVVSRIPGESPNNSVMLDLFCSKFIPDRNPVYTRDTDNAMCVLCSSGILYVSCSDYSSASDFKSAMSGVYLLYKLASPVIESANPYTDPQVVDDFGTEEYIDVREVQIPVGHETMYQVNLRDKLQNAPDSPNSDGVYLVKRENGVNEYVTLASVLPIYNGGVSYE